jgi:tRNA threonylcarbamoyladenosine biosynthesis protein TsaB
MNILALEFSSSRHSVAVARSEPGWPPVVLGAAREDGARHIRAMALVEEALRSAGLKRDEVGRIAVGLGPGSLTGIRAALAVAQGWRVARGVNVTGISAVECLAAEAHEAGLRGSVCVVFEAQRGEYCVAGFDLRDAGLFATHELRLGSRAEVESRGSMPIIGPCAAAFGAGARVMFPDAAMLAKLAHSRPVSDAVERLEPVNLRETEFVKTPAPRPLPAR